MKTVFRVLASRPLLGHWKSKLSVAASLLVALTIGFYVLWHGPEQKAYALDDLPQRLLEIKSIYLTGWRFQPKWISEQDKTAPVKYPVKVFAERPDCYWQSWFSFSGPDTTHKDVRVQSGYDAGKGTKLLSVFTTDKTAMEATVTAIHSELSTEELIQSKLPLQFLGGPPRDFVKTGTETVNNILCDVYEYSFDKAKSKNRLWLNPQTGLPVKIASYDVDKAGQETPIQIFDHVEVNIPASATSLSFDTPEGYQVTKARQEKNADLLQPVAICAGSNDDVFLGVWNCFNIDDKAVLLCWYCEPQSGSKTGDATNRLEFLLAGTRSCDHKEIASADVGGHHWNWSLVWPKQPGKRIGNDDFSVIHRPKQGGLLSTGRFPIRLREDRLKAILEEVQRNTNAGVPGSSKPFTLDMLRTQLDEKR